MLDFTEKIELTGDDAFDTVMPLSPQIKDELPNNPELSSTFYDMVLDTAKRFIDTHFSEREITQVKHGPIVFKLWQDDRAFIMGKPPQHYAIMRTEVLSAPKE